MGGQILFNGQDYTSVPLHKRNFGFVFQSYALFPHLTVFDNVAFGLKMRKMDKETIEILTNKEVIAVNQDPKGEQARRFMDMGEKEIWAKPLANGELAVCFMNRTEFPWKLDYDWRKQTIYFATDVSIRRFEYKVRDLWQHKDLGTTKSNLVAEIPPHGVLMVRLSKVK